MLRYEFISNKKLHYNFNIKPISPGGPSDPCCPNIPLSPGSPTIPLQSHLNGLLQPLHACTYNKKYKIF